MQSQLVINLNRENLARYGIHVSDVADIIETAFNGIEATDVYEADRITSVLIRLPEKYRSDEEAIKNLLVDAPNGERIPLSQLAKAQVGPFHTNTAEGLELSRKILRAQKKEMQQIIMITDGKPSAVTLPDGQLYLNSGGLDQHILQRTFREVAACRKSGILINTFMLAQDPHLVQFVRTVSEIAHGKAYFTSTLTLGQYIMMDFLKGKRRRIS